MTKAEFQDKVSNFIKNKTHECILYAILKSGDIRLIDIERSDMDSLEPLYFELLSNKCLDEDFSLLKYSTADERGNCYYEYDLPEIPDLYKHIRDIQDMLPNGIESFSLKNETVQDIYAILAVLYNGDTYINLYKYFYAVEIVATKGKFLFIPSADRFVRAQQDLLRITPNVDILCLDKTIIILNLKAAEKNEKLKEIIINEAVKNIKHLEATKIISNSDTIKKLLEEDVKLAKRFTQAVLSSPVFKVGITNEQIIDFAKKKEKQLGKFTYSKDCRSFCPNTKRELKSLLTLINDDLLKSELTEGDYIATSKDPIG
jgi:hypothetical protein